jgi:predicted NBD/HSP70 family sugar kinase
VDKFNESFDRGRCESLSDVIETAHGDGAAADVACKVLHDASYLVGKALGSVLTWKNPAALVIGGHFGRDEGPDHFDLISEGLFEGLNKYASEPALGGLQSTGLSRWRYGAAQGGVVLGLQEGLTSFVEDRGALNGV